MKNIKSNVLQEVRKVLTVIYSCGSDAFQFVKQQKREHKFHSGKISAAANTKRDSCALIRSFCCERRFTALKWLANVHLYDTQIVNE